MSRTPSPCALRSSSHAIMQQRRSVRFFSDKPVPQELIDTIIHAAGTAPSGANKQPWRFVAVSDPALKADIRTAAEEEEKLFYDKRASDVWKDDLYPLGTDWRKPFLEVAPLADHRVQADEGLAPRSPAGCVL